MAWLSALLQSLPFANSIMLLWGLAAAVPIIIHLWSKRKYKEVTWAAMEYLLAAVRKNARRIRIEQLILLLIRVAILLLLALALADPTWSVFATLGQSMGGGGDTHFVLVLDASYSMSYRHGERSRFEEARQLAMQVVEDSRQGDGFTAILLADPPQIVIGDPAYDPRDVVDELEDLSLLHGGADLDATLREIQDLLHRAQRRHPRLKQANVCLFTDLGRNTWETTEASSTRALLAGIAKSARVVLFDVGKQDASNAAITRLEVEDPLPTVGRPVNIVAEYQCFSAVPEGLSRLSLLVDDQEVRSERITAQANAGGSFAFSHRFDTAGQHCIEVRLDSDELNVDNHRWLSLPVRESISVLCLQGRQDAAKYVAIALQPDQSDSPRVRTAVRFENALIEEDLTSFDAIFLCNVGRLNRDEAALLRDYVRGGGGLVITLGDQVQLDNYRQQLGGELGDERILPADLIDLSADGEYFFDPLQYRHPLVAPFARHERSGLLTTPVWRYVRTKPIDSSTARMALAYTNGDGAIIEERIGRGHCILLTTAASTESMDRSSDPPRPWTALSAWPSFPPLIQEMLSLAVQGRSENLNVTVGEAITGAMPGVADLPVTVRMPNGDTERVMVQADADGSRWDFAKTWYSGVYTASYGTDRGQSQSFAVNVETSESDLQRMDPELLPSQIQQGAQFRGDPAPAPSTRPTQYFRYILGTVLVLVLLETLLAWKFSGAAS